MGWNASGRPGTLPQGNMNHHQKTAIGKGVCLMATMAVLFVLTALVCFRKSASENHPESDITPKQLIADVHSPTSNRLSTAITQPIEDKDRPAREQPKTNGRLPPKKYIPTLGEIEKARLGKNGKPKVKSIYKSPLEQSLGMIFTTKLGNPAPMLPNIPRITSEKQLQDFLTQTFPYDKEASQSVNENRMMMEKVRGEFKQFLSEGGKVEEFIDYYVGELRSAHESWKSAQKMLLEMNRDGESLENIVSFKEKADALLSEKGIKSLVYPPNIRKMLQSEQ